MLASKRRQEQKKLLKEINSEVDQFVKEADFSNPASFGLEKDISDAFSS